MSEIDFFLSRIRQLVTEGDMVFAPAPEVSAIADSLKVQGRDLVKEQQIKRKLTSLFMLLYGTTMNMKDEGIQALILEANMLVMENWSRLANTYWTAKGQ